MVWGRGEGGVWSMEYGVPVDRLGAETSESTIQCRMQSDHN
jgi:hypothetical protein